MEVLLFTRFVDHGLSEQVQSLQAPVDWRKKEAPVSYLDWPNEYIFLISLLLRPFLFRHFINPCILVLSCNPSVVLSTVSEFLEANKEKT